MRQIAAILFLSLLYYSPDTKAQIGIGNPIPHSSTALDVSSANKGLRIPGVYIITLTDAATILNAAEGLLIWNTNPLLPDGIGYYYNSGTEASPFWLKLAGVTVNNNWQLTGNANTDTTLHFIGTTDNKSLMLRVNNLKAGTITSEGNILLGIDAGAAILPTGNFNNIIGHKALQNNTVGHDNVAVGSFSQKGIAGVSVGNYNVSVGNNTLAAVTTGSQNTAIGDYAISALTTGTLNVGIGAGASDLLATGAKNVAVGFWSSRNNDTGNYNIAIGAEAAYHNRRSEITAVGHQALYNNSLGMTLPGEAIQNTGLGYRALYTNALGAANTAVGYHSLLNNTAGFNTAMGSLALVNNGSGQLNTAVGRKAMENNAAGSNNTAVGWGSLQTNLSGSYNTAVGFGANVGSGALTNATAIGANAIVTAANSLVLGDGLANVGIGVNAPQVKLHVKGTQNIYSGADTHTGLFFAGTSNVDGIELVSSGTDAYVGIQRTNGIGLHISKRNVTANTGLAAFFVNNISIGSISTNGFSTSYNTTSDSRLKEKLQNSRYGLNTLMHLEVKDYNYIADGKKEIQTGLIAQDIHKLYPQAVHKGGADKSKDPWMIDYSKLTPLLIQAMQEQQHIIEEKHKEIDALNLRVEKLEKIILKR